MSCERFRGDFSAWIDGELPEARAAAIAAHVGGCAACRAHAATLRSVDQALGEIPLPTLRPDALAALYRRIALGSAPRWRPMRWAAAAVAAAAALALYFAAAPDPLDSATPEELDVVLELDTVEDLEVIANLEVLEQLVELEGGKS